MIYLKRIKPLRGIKALLQLTKSKQNIQSYLDVNHAFNGNSPDNTISKWASSPQGIRYSKGERLPLLKEYPKNSVGWHLNKMQLDPKYADFNFLQSNKYINPQKAFSNWIVDTHDIGHIVSGYGDDGFGELLRVEYEIGGTYMQGWKVISLMFQSKVFLLNPMLYFKLRPMIKEASQRGKDSNPYVLVDWFEYLYQPLNFVRERILRLQPTTLYQYKDPRWHSFVESNFN